MKILVIAPHPDDEVLGCGGTIKKHFKNGDEIYLCVVTKAYAPEWSESFLKNREKEIECANKILGIKKTYFLDLPTVKLDTISQKTINDTLASCVNLIKPEILYIPHFGDLNKDHRIVFESCLVAARPSPGSSIQKILSYETLSETEWGNHLNHLNNKKRQINGFFLPSIYIDISETVEDKLKAMQCYQSELREFPHPRSLEAIKALSQKRGSEAGLMAAEAFVLIREILR